MHVPDYSTIIKGNKYIHIIIDQIIFFLIVE